MHATPPTHEEPFDYTAPRDSWRHRRSSHPRRQQESRPHRPHLLHSEDETRLHGPPCRVHHAARLPRIARSDRVPPEALGSALRGPGKPPPPSSHPCLANGQAERRAISRARSSLLLDWLSSRDAGLSYRPSSNHLAPQNSLLPASVAVSLAPDVAINQPNLTFEKAYECGLRFHKLAMLISN